MLEFRHLWIALALALLALHARAGNVFIVDAAHPPGTQADIQSAIDLSADGDAIVVRSGTYLRFDLPNRELSIVADQGAVVGIHGAPRLQALSANRTLLLAGLQVFGAYGIGAIRADGLIVDSAAGSVRIEDCSFVAPIAAPADNCTARRGVVLSGCADIAFTRCYIRGQSGADFNFAKGGIGLFATASKVALHDCTVLGGDGGGADECFQIGLSNDLNCHYGYAGPGDGVDGGASCRVVGGELLASGCVLAGGSGGVAHPPTPGLPFYVGGCGGNGIDTSGTVTIWGLASAPTGGPGMAGFPSSGFTDGPPGVPVSPNPAVFTTLPGASRSFSAPAIVREGALIPIHLEGMPADRAALFLNGDPARFPALPFGGWYLVQRPPGSRFLRLGMLDGAGFFDGSLIAPQLAPGELSRTLFLQSIHADVLGGYTLGPCETVVVVDSSL